MKSGSGYKYSPRIAMTPQEFSKTLCDVNFWGICEQLFVQSFYVCFYHLFIRIYPSCAAILSLDCVQTVPYL
jgi:hypothetical protein